MLMPLKIQPVTSLLPENVRYQLNQSQMQFECFVVRQDDAAFSAASRAASVSLNNAILDICRLTSTG